MMGVLQELTRNLVLLLLLATFLEMLLPKSDLNRYIRLVVGLFVLLTILHPLLELFNWQGKVSLPIREPPQEQLEVLINRGIQLGEHRQATALQLAEDQLEKQVEAMLYLAQGIDKVKVDLILDNHLETGNPVITQAVILLTPDERENPRTKARVQEVEAVTIGNEASTPTTLSIDRNIDPDRHSRLVERVTQVVGRYLGIDETRIQVELAGY